MLLQYNGCLQDLSQINMCLTWNEFVYLKLNNYLWRALKMNQCFLFFVFYINRYQRITDWSSASTFSTWLVLNHHWSSNNMEVWSSCSDFVASLSHREATLSPQWWFANSPPLFIHTEASSSDELLCNSHRKPALWLLKRRDGTRHDDDVCVFKVFPRCPPVNHMDTVIMCSDWDPDPPNIL